MKVAGFLLAILIMACGFGLELVQGGPNITLVCDITHKDRNLWYAGRPRWIINGSAIVNKERHHVDFHRIMDNKRKDDFQIIKDSLILSISDLKNTDGGTYECNYYPIDHTIAKTTFRVSESPYNPFKNVDLVKNQTKITINVPDPGEYEAYVQVSLIQEDKSGNYTCKYAYEAKKIWGYGDGASHKEITRTCSPEDYYIRDVRDIKEDPFKVVGNYTKMEGESILITFEKPWTELDINSVTWALPNGRTDKYQLADLLKNKQIERTIERLNYEEHSGEHTIKLIAGPETKTRLVIIDVQYAPKVTIKDRVRKIGEEIGVSCEVEGNPKPKVEVRFYQCQIDNQTNCNTKRLFTTFNTTEKREDRTKKFLYNVNDKATAYGIIQCIASNEVKKKTSDGRLCVYDPEIKLKTFGPHELVPEGGPTMLVCQVPDCDYDTDAKWRQKYFLSDRFVNFKTGNKTRGEFYYNLTLYIEEMESKDEGDYGCVVSQLSGHCNNNSYEILKMLPKGPPEVSAVYEHNLVKCHFTAFPKHTFNLFYIECDFYTIDNSSCINKMKLNHTIIEENAIEQGNLQYTARLAPLNASGIYICSVNNTYGWAEDSISVCYRNKAKTSKLEINAPETVEEHENFDVTCVVPNCDYELGVEFHMKANGSHRILNESIRTVRGEVSHFYNITVNISKKSEFRCEVKTLKNGVPVLSDWTNVSLDKTQDMRKTYLITGAVFGFTVLIFAITVGFLLYRKHLYKVLNKKLADDLKAGKEENIRSDQSLQKQATLLSLDSKWEFSRKQLKLGRQLGEGFSGDVFEGEATGIIIGEEKTTVAVKTAKKNSGSDKLEALVLELKIMSHMGTHPHIVRMLGAVIDRLRDNELFLIVEYCAHGSLDKYLVTNRFRFVDNWQAEDKKQETLRLHKMAISEGSSRDADYVFPELGTGDPDYVIPNELLPLNTDVLLAWSFQVSRGMEFLTERKLVHADLAARNVLLDSNNIAKICDFGMSKNLYAQFYVGQKGTQLPVKWLAIECLKDTLFSIESDVWSFGVLLWEIFSLGMTPYPGIDQNTILDQLEQGYRMPKPDKCPKEIYEIILKCWAESPLDRPSFAALTHSIGEFLEESFRMDILQLEKTCKNEGEEESPILNLFKNHGAPGDDYMVPKALNVAEKGRNRSNTNSSAKANANYYY